MSTDLQKSSYMSLRTQSVFMVLDLDTCQWWGHREAGRTGWRCAWTLKGSAQSAVKHAEKKGALPKRWAIVQITAGEDGHELERGE